MNMVRKSKLYFKGDMVANDQKECTNNFGCSVAFAVLSTKFSSLNKSTKIFRRY